LDFFLEKKRRINLKKKITYPYFLNFCKVEINDTVQYPGEMLLVHVCEDGDGLGIQVGGDLLLVDS